MMSTHHHEQDSNSQLKWRKALIVYSYRMMSTHHHEQDSNYRMIVQEYHSTQRHEQDSNSQLRWRKALIVQV